MTGLNWRLAILALILGLVVGGRLAWRWQVNEYGKQLAQVSADNALQLGRASAAALAKLQEIQAARSALEAHLQTESATHYKEMKDAQEDRKRLADRLATANVRLSVLVDNAVFPSGSDCGLSAAAGAGRVVHGSARVQLNPAHAQRIIGITGDGDDGLKALAACQGYVRAILKK